jgi:hypothetical protein
MSTNNKKLLTIIGLLVIMGAVAVFLRIAEYNKAWMPVGTQMTGQILEYNTISKDYRIK